MENTPQSLRDIKQTILKYGVNSVSDESLARLIKANDPIMAEAISAYVRRKQAPKPDPDKINDSTKAYVLLRDLFFGLTVEHFKVMYLNRRNAVIGIKDIGTGGITGTVADPKIIFREAIKMGATGMILSHNHPSGTRFPSQSDIDLTRKIKTVAQCLDMSVLDHLIITDTGFYSFADEGQM